MYPQYWTPSIGGTYQNLPFFIICEKHKQNFNISVL